MIDDSAIRVLAVIAEVFLATNRAIPIWVTDALETALRYPTLSPTLARQVQAALREAATTEVMAA